MKTNEKQQLPFFAKFLEGQTATRDMKKEQAGGTENLTSIVNDQDGDVTLKFPSDNDEWL